MKLERAQWTFNRFRGLGHTSAVITLRIYAHLWPGEEDRTRAVMDAMLGGLRTGCGLGDTATKEIAGQRA